ncbi:SPOR domain-containing protein, partial [Brevundimonas sp.]|uniref:SPOR domain-containing protein n=1 Tax=Brevundimonas sp. TaxID=1871086 RepID=UPI003D6D69C4
TPAPAPKATPAPAPTAPAAAGGSSGVQIGAFSSTAIADREYAAVASRFGSFASGAEKRVQEVTAANGSTVYRTTFTGLSRDRAVAFCNALKAAGRDCIVR